MRQLTHLLLLISLALLSWTGSSCQRENYADENSIALQFSTDTISFDTVFTTYSTPAVRLTVYNRSPHDIRLSIITLAQGRDSRFRLNVDGDTALLARNVELLAGDSIFIFIQANINPNEQSEPFLIEDAILFSNGQRLPLTAWGRNAVYHQAAEGHWIHVIDCDHWDHSRPHIFLGNVGIDSACTLSLNPGEELYFYNEAMLYVWTGGSLQARGTAEAPILFSSMRHDGWYDYLPGQWQCILFVDGSTNNIIDHAIVENGTGGLRAMHNAELHISNTIVRNMSDAGLIGQGSTIVGDNLLIYDCLASLMVLEGGHYDFRSTTFANYWRYTARDIETVVLSNYINNNGTLQGGDLLQADFTDCIIYGTYSRGEVLLANDSIHTFATPQFIHSLVRGGEWDEDPLFVDTEADDYHLQDTSPATGIGYQYEK